MVDADATAYSDTGVAPNTSYHFRTRAYNGSGSSAYSNTVQVITPDGLALAATGSKVKGVQQVDLEWTGSAGANVDIYRDGNLLATAGGGSYTDIIGKKGGGSYSYQICEPGSNSQCSITVTLAF